MVVPEEERRLLPAAVDHRAATEPDSVYGYIPKGDTIEDGFKPLSMRAYGKAIDEVAWWLDDYLGGPAKGGDFPTVAYVGPNDLRYAIMVIAAAKTLRKVLLPFPANTVHSQKALLEHSKCKDIVFGHSPTQGWLDTLALLPEMKRVQLPELATFLHDRPVAHYEYPKTFAEGLDDPFYVCQTSGTTGNPKPIVLSHRIDVDYVEIERANRKTPELRIASLECFRDVQLPMMLPMSWVVGIAPLLQFPINGSGVTPVLLPPDAPQPTTASYFKKIVTLMPRGQRNAIFSTPEVLREAARDEAILETLRGFAFVGFGGAPLDHHTGDTIAKYTRVQSMIGSTDTGVYPTLLNDPEDWKLTRFHPDWKGWHLEHYTEDTWELCVRRQPHDPRFCFQTNPDLTDYHTKDLFRTVPGRPGFFQSAGRVDDFVKLSTMTKFSATQIEQIISHHPNIRKSLVGGDARQRTFAIVEPKVYGDGRSADEILDELWPAFEEANKPLFGEAKLVKELVLVTDPELPIKTTAKGSVDRRTTLARYEDKIADMYARAGFGGLPEGADRTIR